MRDRLLRIFKIVFGYDSVNPEEQGATNAIIAVEYNIIGDY